MPVKFLHLMHDSNTQIEGSQRTPSEEYFFKKCIIVKPLKTKYKEKILKTVEKNFTYRETDLSIQQTFHVKFPKPEDNRRSSFTY